ncbi:MAG: EF-hand domain-containing protein [Thermodesulfovibrionia bacterium]|nr:EF-hand domain-containing protein [Thermodesulfovibrionia bacterium]
MRRATVKIILGILVIAIMSLGASRSEALHEYFKSLDINNDGKVDLQEFSGEMKKQVFDELDADKNKEVTESEWGSVPDITEEKEHESVFKKIDRDTDSRITFFEFSDYAESNSNIMKAFMGLDMDKNNLLSPDEVSSRPMFRLITVHF